MQIHELNNFSGTLGAGSYLAIDNGTDTGRISSQGLLASTEARIDTANDQITDVKSALNEQTGREVFDNYVSGYYDLTSSVTHIDPNSSPVSGANFLTAIISCNPGDVFYLTSTASSTAKNYAWLSGEASGNIIFRYTSSYILDNQKIVAPPEAAYLLVNIDKRHKYELVTGDTFRNVFKNTIDGEEVLFTSDNKYYSLVSSVTYIDLINPTLTDASGFGHTITECDEGDEFYLTCVAASSAKPYAFLDEDGNILQRQEPIGNGVQFYYAVAPKDAKYFIANGRHDYDRILIKNKFAEKVRALKVFYGFESLGLIEATTNPEQLCAKMPDNSIFIGGLGDTEHFNPAIPSKNSGLLIVKINKNNCKLIRWENDPDNAQTYHGNYDEDSSGFKFSGFLPLAIEGESKKRNNPVLAKELVDVAETYLNTDGFFGNSIITGADNDLSSDFSKVVTAWHEQDEAFFDNYSVPLYPDAPPIDCQNFIKLVLNGIPYNMSQYVNDTYYWRGTKFYSWATDIRFTLIMSFYNWCIANGYQISVGEDFRNLQAGDLLFYRLPRASSPPEEIQFRMAQPHQVGHVVMFTGRFVADESGTKFPIFNEQGEIIGYDTTTKHPQVIEAGGSTNPDQETTSAARYLFADEYVSPFTKWRMEHFVGAFRIPLEEKITWTNINKFECLTNVIKTRTFNTKYQIEITGDGNPVSIFIGSQNNANKIEIGALDANGNEGGSSIRIRTGFMPFNNSVDGSGREVIPTGFVSKSAYYYDEEFSHVNSASSAKYVRRVFGKSDNTDISSSDLSTFKSNYKYNRINAYPFNEKYEEAITVKGTLNDGETAIIDTSGHIYTSEGSELTVTGSTSANIGFKTIFVASTQTVLISAN